MPTIYKPSLDHTPFDLRGAWDRIRARLEDDRVEILTAVGFAAENQDDAVDVQIEDGNAVLDEIARALTLAASVVIDAGSMPANQLKANLKAVFRKPNILFEKRGRIDPATQGAIAQNYQRDEKPRGTFWWDVTGDRGSRPRAGRVRDAVKSALASLPLETNRGRPRQPEIDVLAERLGAIFRGFHDGPIRRALDKDRRPNGSMPDADPRRYREFLDLVLPALEHELREFGRQGYAVNPKTLIRRTLAHQSTRQGRGDHEHRWGRPSKR